MRCELVIAAVSHEQARQAQMDFEAMRSGDLVLGGKAFGRDRVDDMLSVDFFEHEYFVEFAVRDVLTVREVLLAARGAYPGAEINAATQTTCYTLRPGEELCEYPRVDWPSSS